MEILPPIPSPETTMTFNGKFNWKCGKLWYNTFWFLLRRGKIFEKWEMKFENKLEGTENNS